MSLFSLNLFDDLGKRFAFGVGAPPGDREKFADHGFREVWFNDQPVCSEKRIRPLGAKSF